MCVKLLLTDNSAPIHPLHLRRHTFEITQVPGPSALLNLGVVTIYLAFVWVLFGGSFISVMAGSESSRMTSSGGIGRRWGDDARTA
jgi:hypothetical protein